MIFKLPGGIEVTKWWSPFGYRWILHTPTLDAGQIVELFRSIDPEVREALMRAATPSPSSDPPDTSATAAPSHSAGKK